MINVANAKEAVDDVFYRTGTVIRADYAAETVSVLVAGQPVTVPVFYECPAGACSAYAFCVGDEVIVRYFAGQPQYAVGFSKYLWPCVPMPSMTAVSGSSAFSRGLFQQTEFVTSDLTLFGQRYAEITKKTCDSAFSVYVDQPAPDMSGRFVILETDSYVDQSRDVKAYFDGNFLYHTYNANPSGVFNGTRSNILGSYVDPETGVGTAVYQINTFTDWRPLVSGHVDFDFYLYSSASGTVRLCGASCDVVGNFSQASGECVSGVTGFYCDDETCGYMFVCRIKISTAGSFYADASTNFLDSSGRLRDRIACSYVMGGETVCTDYEYATDTGGLVVYPDGTKGQPVTAYYKKKR